MQDTDQKHATRHKRLTVALGVAGVAIGYGLTYAFDTADWPQWRRIGASLVMGLWCAYLLVLTRAGGAFK